MILWSKSSPPRKVSPFVALTSKTPSPNSNIDISNVPPPRSKTAIFSSFFLSNPYAREAAVGSLIMRNTLRPAMRPASLVACLWLSLKVSRYGNNSLGYLFTKIVFCRLLHLLQDKSRNFCRTILFTPDFNPCITVLIAYDLVW